jgi:hypothetical protein
MYYAGAGMVLQGKNKERPKWAGFLEPKHWFNKAILVQFNQLISCSY